MIWIYTFTVAALVANPCASRNWPEGYFVGDVVRASRGVWLRVSADRSEPGCFACAEPRDAAVSHLFADVFQKSNLDWLLPRLVSASCRAESLLETFHSGTGSKLTRAMLASERVNEKHGAVTEPAFAASVMRIVGWRSEKKVIDVYAARVVARVTNEKPRIANFAVDKFVGDTVRQTTASISCACWHRDSAISAFVKVAHPENAPAFRRCAAEPLDSLRDGNRAGRIFTTLRAEQSTWAILSENASVNAERFSAYGAFSVNAGVNRASECVPALRAAKHSKARGTFRDKNHAALLARPWSHVRLRQRHDDLLDRSECLGSAAGDDRRCSRLFYQTRNSSASRFASLPSRDRVEIARQIRLMEQP